MPNGKQLQGKHSVESLEQLTAEAQGFQGACCKVEEVVLNGK